MQESEAVIGRPGGRAARTRRGVALALAMGLIVAACGDGAGQQQVQVGGAPDAALWTPPEGALAQAKADKSDREAGREDTRSGKNRKNDKEKNDKEKDEEDDGRGDGNLDPADTLHVDELSLVPPQVAPDRPVVPPFTVDRTKERRSADAAKDKATRGAAAQDRGEKRLPSALPEGARGRSVRD